MESHKFPILISPSLTISLSIHNNNNVGRLTMLPITVLSACLSIGLSAYLPHCPSVCLSVRLPSVFPPHNLHHTLSLSVHLHLTTSQSHNIHWSLDTHNSISFDYSNCQVQYSCVCVCVHWPVDSLFSINHLVDIGGDVDSGDQNNDNNNESEYSIIHLHHCNFMLFALSHTRVNYLHRTTTHKHTNSYTYNHTLTHLSIHTQTLWNTLIHSAIHSLTHSFTQSLTHSISHSLIYSLTHSLNHPINQSIN